MSPASQYIKDREWEKRWAPDVMDIIQRQPLIRIQPAPLHVDVRQAGDLLVLPIGPKTIGMRVRRPGYFYRYGLDFTLRWKRDTGVETELSKIRKGYADWYFYGHVEG